MERKKGRRADCTEKGCFIQDSLGEDFTKEIQYILIEDDRCALEIESFVFCFMKRKIKPDP